VGLFDGIIIFLVALKVLLMKVLTGLWLLFFISCNDNKKDETSVRSDTLTTVSDTLQKTTSAGNYAAQANDDTGLEVPKTPAIKNPSGFYQGVLPYDDTSKMEQTVEFFNNNTFRLQEKYPGKKDSVVITEGTWMPSNGFIWLYKEQIARGRYKWKGDTLQYFSPPSKKTYTMHPLSDVMGNVVWQNKKKEGVLLYAIGNEPFWSVEFNNKDTVSFQLSDWKSPLKIKLTESTTSNDTTFYLAQTDSTQLKIMVLPYFCTDGMSDYVYQNKIQVQYNHQTYKGCGVLVK
jgi:hypothetical protein